MHIHLDLVGGIAGDMFIASLLDAFPQLEKPLFNTLKSIKNQAPIHYQLIDTKDKGLTGKQFLVSTSVTHDHRSWRDIQELISQLELELEVKNQAIGIFTLLAKVEADIHGKRIEDVHFHEVGAWDCMVDIISASWLIIHSQVKTWSCSDIPWGGGSVSCAHGDIPVPAPATLALLKDFQIYDDGIRGERVTPTGAAILAWLSPSHTLPNGKIGNIGYGFGQRKLSGKANLLRSTVIDTLFNQTQEDIYIIQFDIDDMSHELLSIALEKIRKQLGVIDVKEEIAHGKKNRPISAISILAEIQHKESIINYVFNHTATIGVRYWQCQRTILQRHHHTIDHNGTGYDVKTVQRPDGSVTSKLESDQLHCENINFKTMNDIKTQAEMRAIDDFNTNKI